LLAPPWILRRFCRLRAAVANPNARILAAGGVLWRIASEEPEVAVIHRPRYDDWTFPKGKNMPGESDRDCALREVEEETGLTCELSTELPATEYIDQKGRAKIVHYWVMRPRSGEFEPNREVDELRWLRPLQAGRLLSYRRDVELLVAAMRYLVAPGAN
jgi:8-oxo-dGTP diphosphatase